MTIAQTLTQWMLVFSLLLAVPFSGCLQTENSSTGDDAFVDLDGASTEFIAANEIIQSNCAACHPSFRSYTEEDFINEDYIVPGDRDGSLLYNRMDIPSNSGIMPPSGKLVAEDLQLIEDWINSL